VTGKIKSLGLLTLMLLVVAFCACNRSGSDAHDSKPKDEATKTSDSTRLDAPPAQARSAQAQESLPVQYTIEAIDISPQYLYKDSTITALAKTLPSELPQNMQLRYVFWLNAAIAQDSISQTFTSAAVKKNDLIYVDVALESDGRVLARKRSEMIKILNSSPQIENINFPEINGPGEYIIQVAASDADSDPLSYALAGEGLPGETTIDSTGAVKITLSSQSPESIVFWVVVKDNEDGETRQEIKLNFTKKTVHE
jgi:hypothetical protein